jgi:FemAB-related protein (PEP-CTERM system-associated)
MNIRVVNPSDRNAWDAFVLNHPHGIAYQLFAWQDAIKSAYGFNSASLVAEQNHRIKGILPLIRFHLPLMGSTLISLPYCDAGGPLADSVEIEKQLVFKALDISKQSPNTNGMVTIRSSRPFAGFDPDLTVKREKVRMLLDLPDSSSSLLGSLKAKVRSQVKKPERDGLTSHIGGKEFLHEFYPLFAENMRDLGSPVHSRNWIKSILETYGNRAQLVLVRMPDQTPAAGGILLCHDRTVSVPWASSLRRFNRSNPNMLLYWTFLKFACDNGYHTFDFGRSTPGEGTFRFKKQWGANAMPLHWYSLPVDGQGGDAVSSQKSKLDRVIKIWENLPVGFTRVLGPNVRKYISL